jgi:hypothetical protein
MYLNASAVTSMNSTSCSIFFHNYYGQHEEWIRFFSQTMTLPFTLYYNITGDGPSGPAAVDNRLKNELLQAISSPYLKKLVLRRSPNLGKDIGGKLVLIDASLHEQGNSEYSIFLHDKRSPHSVQGREWRDKLFHIIDPSFAKKALSSFENDKKIGIIAGSNTINNEYDFNRKSFSSSNSLILSKLQIQYNINNTDYRYVAGTMFWCRSLPLLDFFRKHPPLDIRMTLEKGNVMDNENGTNTHAWERLLSWLFIAKGYKINGLE